MLFLNHKNQVMEEIGDDPQWMLTSKLASTPEELAQATLTQGVALQAVRFKRPKAKWLVRLLVCSLCFLSFFLVTYYCTCLSQLYSAD